MKVTKSSKNNQPEQAYDLVPWVLSIFVALLAVWAWGSTYNWQFAGFSTYQFFPVLGLTAYSIMWSTYAVGFLKKTVLKTVSLKDYYRVTGYFVLLLIVLHPGLLIYQRFRDGFGLPPHSYESYVAPGMAWITLLGSVCLLIFLSYELRRFFSKRKWWKYVVYAGDAAMIGIFYHSLRLGSQLQTGWFRTVWWFYGISLVMILAYNYSLKIQKSRNKTA